MAKSAGMTIGNLTVGRGDGNVITLQLNTYHKGQPFAFFTTNEIESLIRVLRKFASAPPPPVEDDDWKSLI